MQIEPAYSSYGAIDLGTNNCRLLIAQPSAEGFDVLDGFSRIVRLGEGLADTGLLSEAAMNRTVGALKVCRARLIKREVDFVWCVTTEACRRADNVDYFLARVQSEVGLEFKVITPREEAELALRGCWQLVTPGTRHLLLFDIGGGSTEVIWVTLENQRMSLCNRVFDSWPIGVVGLSEAFSGHGRITREAFTDMVNHVVPCFQVLNDRYGLSTKFEQEGVQLIGTSGTMTTLAAVQLGLRRYNRRMVDGQDISSKDYRWATDQILDMTNRERESHPCIGPGRADLVVAGCAILEALCRVWPCQKVRVADRGLREGILINMMRLAARGQLSTWRSAPPTKDLLINER